MIIINRLPLYLALLNHQKLGRASFHTPGHKCSGFFPDRLLSLDLTELPDTDALFEADGSILECENILSQLFGAKRSLISAGGCSLAIMTMLKLCAKKNGKVICGRNIHRSAVNAMALLGLEPVWILPSGNDKSFTGRISADSIARAISENINVCACYITSPTYYGELSDIKEISKVCKEHNVPLLVDNAHGSHLRFLKEDLHPITLGASMSACSMHKTLPVLTGGAVLNISDSRFCDEAKSAMSLFGSTSPSYPIMASIDLCADWLMQGGDRKYKELVHIIDNIKATAKGMGILTPSGKCDPLRVTLSTASVGINGNVAAEYFRVCGAECEFSDNDSVVFICTPFNSEDDLAILERAIKSLKFDGRDIRKDIKPLLPKKAASLREAMLSQHKTVSVKNAVGCIAADSACPCPPGIPLVMPGEIIDSNVADMLSLYGISEISIIC